MNETFSVPITCVLSQQKYERGLLHLFFVTLVTSVSLCLAKNDQFHLCESNKSVYRRSVGFFTESIELRCPYNTSIVVETAGFVQNETICETETVSLCGNDDTFDVKRACYGEYNCNPNVKPSNGPRCNKYYVKYWCKDNTNGINMCKVATYNTKGTVKLNVMTVTKNMSQCSCDIRFKEYATDVVIQYLFNNETCPSMNDEIRNYTTLHNMVSGMRTPLHMTPSNKLYIPNMTRPEVLQVGLQGALQYIIECSARIVVSFSENTSIKTTCRYTDQINTNGPDTSIPSSWSQTHFLIIESTPPVTQVSQVTPTIPPTNASTEEMEYIHKGGGGERDLVIGLAVGVGVLIVVVATIVACIKVSQKRKAQATTAAHTGRDRPRSVPNPYENTDTPAATGGSTNEAVYTVDMDINMKAPLSRENVVIADTSGLYAMVTPRSERNSLIEQTRLQEYRSTNGNIPVQTELQQPAELNENPYESNLIENTTYVSMPLRREAGIS